MERIRYYVELPEFKGRNVPIAEIAKAIGKDAQYIRYGLQKGIFTWEETGYFKPEEETKDNEKTLA